MPIDGQRQSRIIQREIAQVYFNLKWLTAFLFTFFSRTVAARERDKHTYDVLF